MARNFFTPTHRNPDRPQPEVCQLTGDLTPSTDLIVSDVEGLRGVHVGSTYPWAAKARLRPSWNDLRRLNPGPPLESSQQKGLSGGSLWFRDGVNVSEQEVCIIPGPDGELIEVFPTGRVGPCITAENGDLITTETSVQICTEGV